MKKKCIECGYKKSIELFKSQRSFKCIDCLKKILKIKEKIKSERKRDIKREFSARGLFQGINKRIKYRKNFNSEEFQNWFKKLDNHNCEYCHISHDKYFKKKVYKKYPGIKTWLKFTLDRKDSSKPYTLKNISICCPLCNYVKGYIFSAKDFREIANQYIKPLYK